ncbi:MAG TPA: DUF6569 family protein [Candidatus Xenobia bacterium]|nr:DUF6569 family protein [Candidatus Xenobia bacterium]
MLKRWFPVLVFVVAAATVVLTYDSPPAAAGIPKVRDWQVHPPILYSNLALFPVSSSAQHDARNYLTLDEGLRSGEVEVTELGAALQRRRHGSLPLGQAQVNRLVLINHSSRPLILLAGEIVTGGKQDRVISRDRVIPPGGDPLPLDVFCVEPGRWHGASASFGASLMAAPKVREKAAVARNQQQVWDATAESRSGVAAAAVPSAEPGRVERELQGSSSYAQMEASPTIKRHIDDASANLQREYERALRGALQGKNVVGVVVAINGEVVWADLFADSSLFQRYWPKLLRSYVVEAMSVPAYEDARASVADAERFLSEQQGKQIIEVEPGEYRLVQIESPRYSIFQLASLTERSEPLLHFNKLRKEGARSGKWAPPAEEPRPMQRRRH